MLRRGFCTLLALGVTMTTALPAHATPRYRLRDPFPRAAAAYATVLDGRLIWGQNLYQRRAPASLTKLLTALVVLHTHWNPNALLTVTRPEEHIVFPHSGFRPGDRVRAEYVLMAMLMHSANDACLILADHVAGNTVAFARLMNARAARLGMRDSHFVQPCGLDAPGQYSTVQDLLRLARAAHADPRIAWITSRAHASVTTASGRVIRFRSTNELLGRMPGVIGMKTGYTAHAGRCLIALAQRAGHRIWVVLLNSPRRWGVAHRLIAIALARANRIEAHARYANLKTDVGPRPVGALSDPGVFTLGRRPD